MVHGLTLRSTLRPALRVLLVVVLCAVMPAPRPAWAQAVARPAPAPLSLDGTWELLLDPQARGAEEALHDPDHGAWKAALSVTVPGPLEATPDTAGYDGIVYYRTTLPAVEAQPARHVMLDFDGVNDRVDVWLEGEWLGRHEGSDVPFRFDVTGRLEAPGKRLTLRVVDPGEGEVDGMLLGARPHAKESWYFNYGGVTGSVRLEQVPRVELRSWHVEVLPGESLDLVYELFNHGEEREVMVTGAAQPADDDRRHAFVQPQLVPPGRHAYRVSMTDEPQAFARWSPADPARHELVIEVADRKWSQAWSGRFGARTFRVVGDHFELNGEPLYLKGVLFQPYWPGTLVHPPDDDFLMHELLRIKAAGFNLVRVHLRSLPAVYAACDEVGLLVQAEPTLGWITSMRPDTLPAVEASFDALADDIAAHPSVVMVGLLNELSGWMHLHADALLDHARSAFPHHVVLEDSGSWAGTSRYLNPGEPPREYDDLHVYRAWPWNEGDAAYVRSLGADHDRLVFVSEYGYGGVATFDRNLAGFDGELWSEDAQVYAAQLADVEAQFARGPAAGIDPDVVTDRAELERLGLKAQAAAAHFMASALRANPRVAGDVYTQWRDVAWEDGAGLADVWGGPKPALAVFDELNALGENPPDPFDTPPTPLPVPAGPIAARGDLLALTPAVEAYVRQRLEPSDASPLVAVVGPRPNMWGAEQIDTTVSLLRWVREGGTALLLEPPHAGRPLGTDMFGYDSYGAVADLPLDLRVRSARGHFVGKHLIFSRGFAATLGLDPDLNGRLFGADFRSVRAPRVLLHAGEAESTAQLLGFDTYGLVVGAAIQTVRYGRGTLVLNTLPLHPGEEQELEDPVARAVLDALLRHAAAVARPDVPPRQAAHVPEPWPESIGRSVWRHRIYFGLAERLAWQDANGRRTQRREPEDLAGIIAGKNAALDLVIAGEWQAGAERLAGIDAGPLEGARDTFLRAELAAARLYGQRSGSPPLPERLRLARMHARSLGAMRDGDTDQAMDHLQRLRELLEALPPEEPEDDEPQPGAGGEVDGG